mmetsp:Transcript_135042/g.234827  ORF Transcript_135042/g.234827 Transcript_135042/m.234827 type:complete len:90 (-) Transcript_135042:48-317(-)
MLEVALALKHHSRQLQLWLRFCKTLATYPLLICFARFSLSALMQTSASNKLAKKNAEFLGKWSSLLSVADILWGEFNQATPCWLLSQMF